MRVLDTRTNLGLSGWFTSPTSRDLLLTGAIATADGIQLVVPAGATAVALNVTVVVPTAQGFLSVRPADAPGAPSTSNVNFVAGQVVPNAVTVQLLTVGGDAGKIEVTSVVADIANPRDPEDRVFEVVIAYCAPRHGVYCSIEPAPNYDQLKNIVLDIMDYEVTTVVDGVVHVIADGMFASIETWPA